MGRRGGRMSRAVAWFFVLKSFETSIVGSSSAETGFWKDSNMMVFANDQLDAYQHSHDRKLQYAVEVSECQDATEYWRRSWDRVYGGVNLLNEHYDCTCNGDFESTFSQTCLIENYCFLVSATTNPPNGSKAFEMSSPMEEGIEVCQSQEIHMEFAVNNTDGLLNLERQRSCATYTKGGPPAPNNIYCHEFSPQCVLGLTDSGYGTELSVSICNDQSFCQVFLQQLDYSPEMIAMYCPKTTLGGDQCSTSSNSGASLCGDEDERDSDNFTYFNLAACDNIVPCARASCWARRRREATLVHIFFAYPECIGATAEDSVTSNGGDMNMQNNESMAADENNSAVMDDDVDLSGGQGHGWLPTTFALVLSAAQMFQVSI